MKNKLLLLSLIGSVFVARGQSVVPQVIAPAGGYGQNAQHNLSWTVGEPVTATLSSGNHTLTQGFQQPNLQLITGISEQEDGDLTILYPNPAVDELFLQLHKTPEAQSHFIIYDAAGKLVTRDVLQQAGTRISLAGFAAGTYTLSIQLSNKPLKNYSIIKQN